MPRIGPAGHPGKVSNDHQGVDRGQGVEPDSLGWVRKHLSDGQQPVRGVVLTGWTSDELVYAATALKDSVTFLGWRLSLGFEALAP